MKYYLKKILGFIFTILLVSIITFVVFQILPGDPAQIILGVDADPAQLENLRATMNLDKGYVERYFIWLINALHGDLGVSYRYSREVSDLIAESFFVTSSLAVFSIALTVLIGLPLGIFIAKNSKKKITTGISMLSQLGISVPSFCMGIVLISIFSVNLGWFDLFRQVKALPDGLRRCFCRLYPLHLVLPQYWHDISGSASQTSRSRTMSGLQKARGCQKKLS